MRIYDARIAKFLSVDPLTAEYPWYTPYQFAGNKPIRYIDRDGEEEEQSINKYWQNQVLIDINNAPKTGKTNAQGFTRNGLYVAKTQFGLNPEMFSVEMQTDLFINKRMPTVDENWIKYNPEHAAYKGRALIHHHIDGENMTVLIPDKLHYDRYSSLHAYLKNSLKGSSLKSFGKGLLGNSLNVLGMVSMFNLNDPDSWINAFENRNPEETIGTVVKDWDSNTYWEIERVEIITLYTTDQKTKETKSRIIERIVTGTRYESYIKDEDGNRKGIDKIETTTEKWRYDEKGARVSESSVKEG